MPDIDITEITTTNNNLSINDIKNKIKEFTKQLTTLREEFLSLVQESFDKQKKDSSEYDKQLNELYSELAPFDGDEKIIRKEWEKLTSYIKQLDVRIKDNDHVNKTLKEKITVNNESINDLNKEINQSEKFIKKLDIEFKAMKENNCVEINEESLSDFSDPKERNAYIDLMNSSNTINEDDAKAQNSLDNLLNYYNQQKEELIKQKNHLEKENDLHNQKIKTNNYKINELKTEIKDLQKEDSKLQGNLTAVKEKIEKIEKMIKTNKEKFDSESKNYINTTIRNINEKKNKIIILFAEFKKFYEEIKTDFDYLLIIKEEINTFLIKFFLKQTNYVGIDVMKDYNDCIESIINKFIKDIGENKYSEILACIKDFNNYKKTNIEVPQPSTSNEIIIEETTSESEIIDLEKLQLSPSAIISIVPKYKHFFQEYKNVSSRLLLLSDNILEETKKRWENNKKLEVEKVVSEKDKELKKQIKDYNKNILKNKKVENIFYFAEMLLLEECDENEKFIFEELDKKNKSKKKNKNIIFNKDKTFGLIYTTVENNGSLQSPFLINFTTIQKMPKKFTSLVHDYKKNDNLNQKIFQKVCENFKQKSTQNYKFELKDLKHQNNNINRYLKNLELLYQNINIESSQLVTLEKLFEDFTENIFYNKELKFNELKTYEAKKHIESQSENNHVYQMAKKIFEVFKTTHNSMLNVENHENSILPSLDIEAINQEESIVDILSSEPVKIFIRPSH